MPPTFVIFFASVACLVGAGFWLRHWRSAYEKTIRAMRRVSRHRIADAPGGELVRIVGTVREGPRTMEAPLSGRAPRLASRPRLRQLGASELSPSGRA